MKRPYDSTVARIAGNIASGAISNVDVLMHVDETSVALFAVRMARAIVAECERTEQPPSTNAVDPSAQLPGTPTPRA